MKPTKTILSLGRLNILFLFVLMAGWFSLAPAPALAAPDSPACSANPESRQLDFWLGDWTVTYPGLTGSSASKVSLDLDKCMVIETWRGAKGHTGKNMFAYSADDQRWHGLFADNEGRVHIFEGKVSQGRAEFTGPSQSAEGKPVLNRIKVVRVNPTQVEQSWEKSADNGATWTAVFHGQYSRKNQ
jgi:hypothetical protein